jgi:hypothetical protein
MFFNAQESKEIIGAAWLVLGARCRGWIAGKVEYK